MPNIAKLSGPVRLCGGAPILMARDPRTEADKPPFLARRRRWIGLWPPAPIDAHRPMAPRRWLLPGGPEWQKFGGRATNIGAGSRGGDGSGDDRTRDRGTEFLRDRPALAEFHRHSEKNSGAGRNVRRPCLARGVHSHQSTLFRRGPALLNRCGARGCCPCDHRPGATPAPVSAEEQIAQLAADLPPGARIVTVSRRYFAMDRDKPRTRCRGPTTPSSTHGATAAMRPAIIRAATWRRQDDAIPSNPPWSRATGGMAEATACSSSTPRRPCARNPRRDWRSWFDGFDRGPRPPLAARLGMVDYFQGP